MNMADRYLMHDRVRAVIKEELGAGATELDIAEATIGAAALMIDGMVTDQVDTQSEAIQEICREVMQALGKALRALYPDTAEGNGAIVELRVQATGVAPITHAERVGFEMADDGFALDFEDMVNRSVASYLDTYRDMDLSDRLTSEALVDDITELLDDDVDGLHKLGYVEAAIRRLHPELMG